MNPVLKAARQVLADVAAERLKATVYRHLETRPMGTTKEPLVWTQPGNVGNDGGASAKPHGTTEWYPTVPELVTVRPAAAFDNFFYLLTFPIPAEPPSNFVLSFDNYSVAAKTLSGLQALECQLEFRDGLNTYNMAWQFDQVSKSLRAFTYKPNATGNWFAPDVKLPYPDLAKPLSFKAEFRIDREAEQVTHDCVWLNGTQYAINVNQRATMEPKPMELSVSFQVDPNSAEAVTAIISNLSVAWV